MHPGSSERNESLIQPFIVELGLVVSRERRSGSKGNGPLPTSVPSLLVTNAPSAGSKALWDNSCGLLTLSLTARPFGALLEGVPTVVIDMGCS